MTAVIPWHTLTEREKFVWATVYALNASAPEEGVRKANVATQALHALNVDGIAAADPEYDAASSGTNIKWEEFLAWYPVALSIRRRGRISALDIDEAACRRAFEVYRLSKSDYY